MPKKERRTKNVIHISRKDWDKLRASIRRVIYPNVKVIENEKDGGDNEDVDLE